MIALRLSKSGYGTIEQILSMNTELVLSAFSYEDFCNEYENQFYLLNRQDDKR